MRAAPVVTMAAVVLAVRDTPGISSHELADFFGCSVKAIRSHALRACRESLIRNVSESGAAKWEAASPADDDKAEQPVQRTVPASQAPRVTIRGPVSVWDLVQ
jgi:hypothetical protein